MFSARSSRSGGSSYDYDDGDDAVRGSMTFWTCVLIFGVAVLAIACGATRFQDFGCEQPKYKTIIIDGCRYIELDQGTGSHRVHSLTHAGNCPNH